MAREGAEDVRVEDYDLIGIVAGTTSLSRKLARRRVEGALARRTNRPAQPVSIGLLPVEGLIGLPFTLFNYELKYGSLVLYGTDPTGAVPAYDATRLPVVEATRLLINRGVLIWGAATAQSASDPTAIAVDDLCHCYRKVLQALGDALLIRDGAFHWSYLERGRNAARCEGFEEFAGAGLRSRYLAAINGKRTGVPPRLPTADHAKDIMELFALHQEVFRSVERQRLGRDYPTWTQYAARGVGFPRALGGSPLRRFARLLKCFGPPRGAGFYRRNAGCSDEEVLTAAFPLLAYDGVRDGTVVGRLLNRRVEGHLTAPAVWERFHAVWARGH
jgi:hypothetical protein